MALAHTFHDWSRAHPYDFALLYGSPVPGYRAPGRTIASATRVARVLMGVLRDQLPPGSARPATSGSAKSAPLHVALADIRAFAEADLPDELVLVGLQAWSGLIGSVTLELFGHLVNAVDDHETSFEVVARRLAPVLPQPAPVAPLS